MMLDRIEKDGLPCYLETMNEILPRVQHKFVVDDDLKGVLPLLNLNALKASGADKE